MTRTAPPLTPKAQALIRDLQAARQRLAAEHERITRTTPAGQDPRPDAAHGRRRREVERCWERLAALGFTSRDVAHYLNARHINAHYSNTGGIR